MTLKQKIVALALTAVVSGSVLAQKGEDKRPPKNPDTKVVVADKKPPQNNNNNQDKKNNDNRKGKP